MHMDLDIWDKFFQDDLEKFKELFKEEYEDISEDEDHITIVRSFEDLMSLVNTMKNHSIRDANRKLAATKLLTLFEDHFEDYYLECSEFEREEFIDKILNILQKNMCIPLRETIIDVIIQVIKKIISKCGIGDCLGVPDILIHFILGKKPDVAKSALFIFTHVWVDFIPNQDDYMDHIIQMLQESLSEKADYNVRFQAVFALFTFIIINKSDSSLQNDFIYLLPKALQVINKNEYVKDLNSLLKILRLLVTSAPGYVLPQSREIFKYCKKIFQDNEVNVIETDIALDIMILLPKSLSQEFPKFYITYIDEITTILLNHMADFEDNWMIMNNIREEDVEKDTMVELWPLYIFASRFGDEIMFSTIINKIYYQLERCLDSDWRQRYAALNAIAAISESCSIQIDKRLKKLVSIVVKQLSDKNPYVRYAASTAISHMSRHCSHIYSLEFYDRITLGLLPKLKYERNNPRIQANAIYALYTYIEYSDKHIILHSLKAILLRLRRILSQTYKDLHNWKNKVVLHEVITAILIIYAKSIHGINNSYIKIFTYLKYIIANSTTEQLIPLRYKCVHCMSVIALNVTNDCRNEIEEVMKNFGRRDAKDLIPDNKEEKMSLLISWRLICEILGKSFAKYLGLKLVMNLIINTLQDIPKMYLINDEDLEDVVDHPNWFITNIESDTCAIRRKDCEYILLAHDLVEIFVEYFSEEFLPYINNVYPILIASLSSYNDDIRYIAGSLLFLFLEVAESHRPSDLNEPWKYECMHYEIFKAIQYQMDDLRMQHMKKTWPFKDDSSSVGYNAAGDTT